MTESDLYQGAGPLALEGPTEIRAAGVRMAAQARREIWLLSRDLDPALFDDLEFIAALRHLAVRRRDLPVKILIFDPVALVHRGHRLIPLIHHLTSRIAVRCVPETLRGRIDAFLVADEAAYLRLPQADIYKATADFQAPLEARRLRAELLALWDQSEPCQELRRLHL